MTILVVAAHPDDEVLGCGGTIAKLAKAGQNVFAAILGEGITSRFDRREEAENSQMVDLRGRCGRVAKFFNLQDLFLYDFPDNRFDTVPLLDIVKIIEKLIRDLKPTAIYTHYAGDLNIDHSITFRAVVTAARPVKGCSVSEIRTFEIASSTEWSFGQLGRAFTPNFFVDITETLDMKIEAMQMYESETRHFPHPRSSEALEAAACRWGSAVGVDAAEAFELVRAVMM